MTRYLMILNFIVSLGSAVAAAIALARPSALSQSSHIEGGELFYARMYAARAIPFGVACATLPFRARSSSIKWLLLTAAAIQTADVAIAMQKKKRDMVISATVAAVAHVCCTIAIE